MDDLVHQRCSNHKYREAVARCPECTRFFCRECITEHEDQVLCASCLIKRLNLSPGKSIRLDPFIGFFQCLLGGMVLWIFFFYLGKILLSLPTDFHEGNLWLKGW
ncbi:rhomboid family protein [Thermodesulfobacteriota bacterium]